MNVKFIDSEGNTVTRDELKKITIKNEEYYRMMKEIRNKYNNFDKDNSSNI